MDIELAPDAVVESPRATAFHEVAEFLYPKANDPTPEATVFCPKAVENRLLARVLWPKEKEIIPVAIAESP